MGTTSCNHVINICSKSILLTQEIVTRPLSSWEGGIWAWDCSVYSCSSFARPESIAVCPVHNISQEVWLAKWPIKLYFAWPILEIDLPLILIHGTTLVTPFKLHVEILLSIVTQEVNWSLWAWSLMLFVRGESAPEIHLTHRFPLAISVVSQPSQVTVLHSWSKSRLHFSYVEYITFRFLGSRASSVVLLVAALFILPEQLAKVDSETLRQMADHVVNCTNVRKVAAGRL